MFTKKYFQDRQILFLNIALVATTLLTIIAAIIRIDTGKSVVIIRYQVAKELAGYGRGDAWELYTFVLASIFFTSLAIFLSAKLYHQKRMLSLLLLSLTLVVLIFNFVVSNAIYNLR
jgi:hypothetical protein